MIDSIESVESMSRWAALKGLNQGQPPNPIERWLEAKCDRNHFSQLFIPMLVIGMGSQILTRLLSLLCGSSVSLIFLIVRD